MRRVPSRCFMWQVMGHKRLLETNADIILQQKINLRAPYVTPLNVLQACDSPHVTYHRT